MSKFKGENPEATSQPLETISLQQAQMQLEEKRHSWYKQGKNTREGPNRGRAWCKNKDTEARIQTRRPQSKARFQWSPINMQKVNQKEKNLLQSTQVLGKQINKGYCRLQGEQTYFLT